MGVSSDSNRSLLLRYNAQAGQFLSRLREGDDETEARVAREVDKKDALTYPIRNFRDLLRDEQKRDERRQLAELLPIRPALSPTEEISLFAALSLRPTNTPPSPIEAIAEDGQVIEAESINSAAQRSSDRALQLRTLQRNATQRYDAINEVVFSAYPLTAFAA